MEYKDLTPLLDVVHSGPTSTDVNAQAAQLYKELSGNQDTFNIPPVVQGLRSKAGFICPYILWTHTAYSGIVSVKVTALSGYKVLDLERGIIATTATTWSSSYVFMLGYYNLSYNSATFTEGWSTSPEYIALGETMMYSFTKCPILNAFKSGNDVYIIKDMTFTSSNSSSGSGSTKYINLPGIIWSTTDSEYFFGGIKITDDPNGSPVSKIAKSSSYIDLPFYYRASASGSLTKISKNGNVFQIYN